MPRRSLIRSLTLAGALLSAVSLTGATLAATASLSTHASSTAVAAVAAHRTGENADQSPIQNAHSLAVSTAAESDIVGGAHQNHGGYVSCVARGGSDCTSTTPTLPSHGSTPELPTQAQVPAR